MATRILSRRSLIARNNFFFSSSSSSAATSPALSFSTRRYFSASAAAGASSAIRRLRPSIYEAGAHLLPARRFATSETSNLNVLSPPSDGRDSKSNQPHVKREEIMLDGCDFEHWLIMMDKPEGEPPRDQIIDSYIKTLATIVGSEEEARMKIYSVSTKHYYAFSCLLSEEVAKKLNGLPGVSWVLPDAYVDVRNKDYGGEPFINGQAVPYDPKYHEEWVRNNSRGKGRSGDRPRGGNRNRAPTPGNMNNFGPGTPDGGRAF